MLEFAASTWLLALPLPWLGWWALARRHASRAERGPQPALRHPQAALLARLAAEAPARPSRLPWLWALGCALVIIALARPQWVTHHPYDAPGRDIMLAIDVSGSMRAQDFVLDGRPVDRLSMVKHLVGQMLEAHRGDRAGVIVFGEDAYTVTPITPDLDMVRELLAEIDNGMAGERTALGEAVALAVKRLQSRPPEARILILLTDGSNTAGEIGPLAALALAKDIGVRIYSIGIGRSGKVAFPRGPAEGPAFTEIPLDETLLKHMAEQTGGRYYRAADATTISQIVADIDALETVTISDATPHPPTDYYWLPALAALVLLALIQLRRGAEVLP